MHIALSLIGGLALFLFGLNIVSKGLSTVSGGGLRNLILVFTRNRFYSSAIGFAMAVLLQSSSAMSVLLVGLADSGILHLRAAIPLLLGANIGATVTVQLIAFNLSDVALLLIAAGFFARSLSREETVRAVGEIILGFGLVFYGMGVMSMYGSEMAEHPEISSFLAYLEGHPASAVLVATLLTAILQASAATIGIAITMTAAGLISLDTAFYIVAGANIGTVATAVISGFAANYRGRRVAVAHLLLRIIGAVIFISLMPFFMRLSSAGGTGEARSIANANTLFSVALFIVAIPFTNQLRLLARRLIPSRTFKPKPLVAAKYLEKKFIPYPAIALNQSWKEISRIFLYLGEMTADIGQLFTKDDMGLVRKVKRREKYVDSLVKQTVTYLISVSQGVVPDAESKYLVDQLFILDNLESISDALKRMGSQSAKRIDAAIVFSAEGAKELEDIHKRVSKLLRRLDRAFKKKDMAVMREILAVSVEIDKNSEDLKISHFQRLMSGKPTSESSTTIHMELLNQITQANTHIGIIAGRMSPGIPSEHPANDDSDALDIME